ncbi:hypothetical protein ACQZ61_15705 [Agrobacterium vitis]|uniref:hypothetical protein n=1 Tax=Agrobacterium vitis TaxID=373 RepID=UPI0015D96968|nr:hypothetical protein [Agrobacterium vitis]MCF1453870.1 hypothetical protein [Agrobacterium vitis]BCH52604.1 hypothetical protein RvVAR031_02140 [Agrobacterium vitis]
MPSIPLDIQSVEILKLETVKLFPLCKSSHITEALAGACGFNSHAALLAKIKELPRNSKEYRYLLDHRFISRLNKLSGAAVVPQNFSFDSVGFPPSFKIINTRSVGYERVDYSKSKRGMAWRNMMIAGINSAIEMKLLSILPGDNRWPGAKSSHGDRGETYAFEFSVAGVPAVGSVFDAGFDEVSVHVAFWPTSEGKRWVRAAGSGFMAGEAYAQGYLERKNGAWLQVPTDLGGSTSFKCRTKLLSLIASLDFDPLGYADRGSFII